MQQATSLSCIYKLLERRSLHFLITYLHTSLLTRLSRRALIPFKFFRWCSREWHTCKTVLRVRGLISALVFKGSVHVSTPHRPHSLERGKSEDLRLMPTKPPSTIPLPLSPLLFLFLFSLSFPLFSPASSSLSLSSPFPSTLSLRLSLLFLLFPSPPCFLLLLINVGSLVHSASRLDSAEPRLHSQCISCNPQKCTST